MRLRRRSLAPAAAALVASLLGAGAGARAAGDRATDGCAAILAKSSTEWVATCAARGDGSTEATEDALARYGECYDAATDALAERVLRETGPSPASGSPVPRCLAGLQASLEGFTEYALGAALTSGTYSRVATAYASLYEKQLRRLAWEAAAPDPPHPSPPDDGARLAAARSRLDALLVAATPRLRSDLSERFEKLRHAAEACGIAPAPVYEFAISLLQSPADPPFAPPPF